MKGFMHYKELVEYVSKLTKAPTTPELTGARQPYAENYSFLKRVPECYSSAGNQPLLFTTLQGPLETGWLFLCVLSTLQNDVSY